MSGGRWGNIFSDATPFFQNFVDSLFYGLIECVGLMVAEDLLGANQLPQGVRDKLGEAGGGVVDGGGDLEMFPSTALRTGPSTALRTGFKGLDSGESFNEMFDVAAHCVDLVLEG